MARLERGLSLFVALATVFAGLLLGDAWRAGVGAAVEPAVPYVLASASVLAFALTVALGALHGVERLVRPHFALVASSAALVALTAPLLFPVAEELASGDGIARTVPRAVAIPVAALALELAALVVWGWHRSLLRAALEPRVRLGVALGLVGVVVASMAYAMLQAGMQAYAFVSDVVVVFLVAIAGTLVYALFSRATLVRGALSVAGLLAIGFGMTSLVLSPNALAEGRELLLPTSHVAARFDRFLWSPTRSATLRIGSDEIVQCRERPASPAPSRYAHPGAGPRNVLVISIDALRADALTWERGGRLLMPELAEFVAGSVYAPNAVSPYPATIFAVGSALTGLHPSRALFAPSPAKTVLARAAEGADVRTAHVPDVSWFRTPAVRRLLLEGLGTRRHRNAAAEARAVVDEIGTARAAGRSYVVWAHFYEPHEPYDVHPGYEFGDRRNDRYASEIAYLDAWLAMIFHYLEESGAYDDTLVVLFADHGEALGERGYHGHHVFLDGFMTDVPVAVRAPGLAPRTVHGVVELTDVAATIAHYAGLSQHGGSAGTSLLAGDPPADRIAVSEAFPIRGTDLFALANAPVRTLVELDERMVRIHEQGVRRYSPKVAIVSGDYRLIVDRHSGMRELYHRGRPSSEQPNVASLERSQLARLTSRLERWHRDTAEAIYCAVREGTEDAPPSMPAAALR